MTVAPWKKDLAMIATYSRMLLSLPLILILYWNHPLAGWVAAIVFVIGSLTDWLDGYWARKYQAESDMGKFMDPIADKILVLGPLVMLQELGRIEPLMVILLLGRDIFIGGIRSAAATQSIIIAARPFGKWKTAIQMVSLPCLLIYENIWGLPIKEIGYYGMWISVALSLTAGFEYCYGYFKGKKQSA